MRITALRIGTFRSIKALTVEMGKRAVIHGVLRELRDRSILHMPDDKLRVLDTFARGIRGEINK